jgi:hypothetical protein
LNLAHRHASRVEGQDLVVEAGKAALMLRHQKRLERPSRSRGTSTGSGPPSVKTVLLLAPL